MPVTHLLHPKTLERLSFEEAPRRLDTDGILPYHATWTIVEDLVTDGPPHEFVRPSDVTPNLTCRRRVVWERFAPYGVNPLEQWPMHEGTAVHDHIDTAEVEVPEGGGRVEVLGVMMRGRIDILTPTTIEDIKSKSAYFKTVYPPKDAPPPKPRPYVDVWEPPDPHAEAQIQVSLYNLMLVASGQQPRQSGVMWRLWRGLKAEKAAWQRFTFPLLSEAELEEKVGPWVRSLAGQLQAAKHHNPESEGFLEVIKATPADGRGFTKSDGSLWCCLRCAFKQQCDRLESWSAF